MKNHIYMACFITRNIGLRMTSWEKIDVKGDVHSDKQGAKGVPESERVLSG